MRNFCKGRLSCAPKFELNDTADNRRYLIMQYLQEDLEDHINKAADRDKAIQKIAV